MTLDWLYRLSDWNPQFFREVKGRLKPRTLTLIFTVSALLQLSVLFYFWSVLPGPDTSSNPYCMDLGSYYNFKCLKDDLGNPLVNWEKWWFSVFQVISWGLPFILLVAGVYMLIGDLGKEERRGTLNFIRLSPQNSRSILLGKLLGVPIVPFLTVALAIPLHLWSAMASQASLAEVLSIYLFAGAVCCCFYTGALLYAFLGGFQGWVGALVVLMSYTFFCQIFISAQSVRMDNILWLGQWFWLPIGSSLPLALGFGLLTFLSGAFWNWQAANRRFRNPNTTLLSKRQSYLITLCFELWLLGFVFRDRDGYNPEINDLAMLSAFNLIWFLVLIAALTPQRQTLLDWSRYRRERVSSSRHFWSRSILRDLLWGEKSPAILAIALNLLLTAALLLPWIAGWSHFSSTWVPGEGWSGVPNAKDQLHACLTLLFGSLFVLICAVLTQLMLFLKTPKRAIWATGALAVLIVVPPIVLGILSMTPTQVPILWLFSAFAFAAFETASVSTIFAGFLAHLGLLTVLTMRLTRQLKAAGESELKALLAAAKV